MTGGSVETRVAPGGPLLETEGLVVVHLSAVGAACSSQHQLQLRLLFLRHDVVTARRHYVPTRPSGWACAPSCPSALLITAAGALLPPCLVHMSPGLVLHSVHITEKCEPSCSGSRWTPMCSAGAC